MLDGGGNPLQQPWRHPWRAQLVNAVLLVAAPAPSFALYHLFTSYCGECTRECAAPTSWVGKFTSLWSTETSCQPVLEKAAPGLLDDFAVGWPWDLSQGLCQLSCNRTLFLNALLLINLDLVFWLVGLVQGSFWLIDPYWTVVPPLIGAFAFAHPRSVADPARSAAVLGLLGFWAVRLGHSYLRREGWCLGMREDWRYADIRRRRPWSFQVTSLFEVFLLQHAMLFGLCLPVLTAHASSAPWSAYDTAGVAVCAGGILVAGAADCQLHAYTRSNAYRAPWVKKRLILDTGLWKYSRHPNYVGEMAWWWGLNLFSFGAGGRPFLWTCAGAAFNTAIMVVVTVLTERRMAAGPRRRAAWEEYCRKTPAWVLL